MTDIKGLVGFTRDRSIISKIIRIIRGSKFSHCFVITGNLVDKTMIGEAMEFGVRNELLQKYMGKNSVVELWDIENIDASVKVVGLKRVMDLTGRNYGYFQLVGFLWIWLMDKFGVQKNNPFQGGIICSEYGYYFLKEIGYNKLDDIEPNSIAPDHIRNVFLEDINVKRVARKLEGETVLTWEG